MGARYPNTGASACTTDVVTNRDIFHYLDHEYLTSVNFLCCLLLLATINMAAMNIVEHVCLLHVGASSG